MKTVKSKGTAYETGKQVGQLILEQNGFPKAIITAQQGPKRAQYAMECERIYDQYDPDVPTYLHGICDALKEDYDVLRTFLFGMYAFGVEVCCSCIVMKQGDQYWLGRNSDFLKAVQPYCLHEEVSIQASYAYVGNTTAFIELEDGMNEKGLCVGLTMIRSNMIKPGFNAGMLVRYLLAHCGTVKEAIEALHRLPIGSAQTLTMMDAVGDMAVIECNCEQIEVIRDAHFACAVNLFQSERMQKYRLKETEVDLRATDRWHTLMHAKATIKELNAEVLKDILSGVYGFLCQYPPMIPADTIWSVVYHPSSQAYELCDGNPSREPFQTYKCRKKDVNSPSY